LIRLIEEDIGGVIGIGRLEPSKALEDLSRIKRSLAESAGGGARPSEAEILALIQGRADARKAKDFARADQIRQDLDARGVVIKDGPTGTTWTFK
jgi:cysteinyl-tRNA synthetase